ncbi:MAG: hypothetical protein L0Z50_15160, partial [Verrucomicrobiales bacterium]|nr:hypothetical protein [Verrucomicrobiales bacterium]
DVLFAPLRWNRFRVADARPVWAAKPRPFLGERASRHNNEKQTNEGTLENLAHMELANSSAEQQRQASKKCGQPPGTLTAQFETTVPDGVARTWQRQRTETWAHPYWR